MNKKLLFGIVSLAALTACTNDDFESQKVAQEVSPIQFEVLNNDVATRASMDGNKIVWSANDGDIFTLYHGGAGVTGYENAIYTAKVNEGAAATLTTPSMIKAGNAVMVWPADTMFRIRTADNLSIEIPADQEADIENYIPYMSDQINIYAYGTGYSGTHVNGTNPAEPNSFNTEGKDRKYPVFMRPMASQLIVKADYAGTDAKIAQLYTGADPINPISVSRIDLLTQLGGADEFTTNLDVNFTAPAGTIPAQWATVANNAWTAVTGFNLGAINAQSDYLTTKCLDGNNGCKFLILPQAPIGAGVDDGAVVVNTIYGKVVIADAGLYGSQYTFGVANAEIDDAWYRFISQASKDAGAGVGYDASETPAATAGSDGKYKTTANIADGLMQTINVFSTYTHQADGVVKGEPEGAAATRFVKVLLNHLDMSDLHIDNDKWLRDAARVWNHMGLPDVTVYLDGAANGEFLISQNTIDVINKINADLIAVDGPLARQFHVQPCDGAIAGHNACNTIVVTGGGAIRDLRFIEFNDVDGDAAFGAGDVKANVALKAGETWSWTVDADGNYIVIAPAEGVNSIINRGTMTFAADATLQTSETGFTSVNATAANPDAHNNIPFVNNGTLNVNSGTLYVQVNVTNNGTVNIAKNAQYRQDGRVQDTEFINNATNKPSRFKGGNDKQIGKVENKGVFATVSVSGYATKATINNYGLIEHADANAKTYITTNAKFGAGTDADFATAFGANNKMGRINLPYSNKDEDNISISAAANQGFVSITVDGDAPSTNLNETVVGERVNYVIIKSGIETISALPNTIKYVEINQPNTEIAWKITPAVGLTYGEATYTGLIVLSPVNIKLNTFIHVTDACYLGADMYVGGVLNDGAAAAPAKGVLPSWNGYYGNTTSNFATKYITY